MITSNADLTIISYSSVYKTQVIDLVDFILREQNAIEKTSSRIDDADLYTIESTYMAAGHFWLAVNRNQVVGTVAIKPLDVSTAKLKRMFVDVSFRGTGLAQNLYQTAESFALSKGCKKIVLNTHLNMKRAHNFYRKIGFKYVHPINEKLYFEKELIHYS